MKLLSCLRAALCVCYRVLAMPWFDGDAGSGLCRSTGISMRRNRGCSCTSPVQEASSGSRNSKARPDIPHHRQPERPHIASSSHGTDAGSPLTASRAHLSGRQRSQFLSPSQKDSLPQSTSEIIAATRKSRQDHASDSSASVQTTIGVLIRLKKYPDAKLTSVFYKKGCRRPERRCSMKGKST